MNHKYFSLSNLAMKKITLVQDPLSIEQVEEALDSQLKFCNSILIAIKIQFLNFIKLWHTISWLKCT